MLTFLAGVAAGIWGKSISLWLRDRAGAFIANELKRIGW